MSLAQFSRSLALKEKYTARSEAPEPAAEAVAWMLDARRERSHYLPTTAVSERAWDMMLELFHAELTRRRVGMTGLCLASGVPMATAIRHIATLVDAGLVRRIEDQHDKRRVYIELTPDVSTAMRRYFADVIQPHSRWAL